MDVDRTPPVLLNGMSHTSLSMESEAHAVVVGGVAYGDRSRIVRLLTRAHGCIPLWVANAGKQKALWHPMAHLEISDLKPGKGQGLWMAKECRRAAPQLTFRRSPERSAVGFFVAEVLSACLEEGAPAEDVYALTLQALDWLETEEQVPWIHVKFMAHLVEALGMMPPLDDDHGMWLDVATGDYVDPEHATKSSLSPEVVSLLRQIPGMNFGSLQRLPWTRDQRKPLVLGAYRYVQAQLGKQRELKSYDVLEALFA